MSVLDKAFIKAYNKGPRPDPVGRRRADDRPPRPELSGESDGQTRGPAETSPSSPCPASNAPGRQVNRVDPAHLTWTDQFAQPHYQQLADDGCVQLACADNCDVLTDALQPSALASGEAQTGEVQSGDAGNPAAEVPTEDAAESLRSAAALKLPSVLGLPEVFQPLAEPPAEQPAADEAAEFSASWEVDRFAWPAVCQGLLDSQARYFQHVGGRLMAATAEGEHVILVSGSHRGEGRTTLALCLARCAAEAGADVALVDADFQNPQLGVRLGLDAPCSWLDAVDRQSPLPEVAVSSVDDRLTVFLLAGGRSLPTAQGNERLVALLERVSRRYPLVIVDAGPLDGPDVCAFAGRTVCPIDTAIVVRDLRNTAPDDALAAARRLQQSGIQAVGIAENFRTSE
jgi:Mrp family chromosome partitioning ATPase